MRLRPVLILVLVLLADLLASGAAVAWAQSTPAQREKVAAANEAAAGALCASIGRITLAKDVTVDQFLARTGGTEQFMNTLREAELLGGPRWLDDQTCQVRVEITGRRVAYALLQIAASNPKKSPVPAEALAVRLGEWERRTFSATGSSTGAAEIEDLRPREEAAAWRGVTDEQRRQAVAAARQDAVRKAIQSVETVKLPGGTAVGEVLAAPAVRERVEAWLATRPVTGVAFRDDLKVNVQLSAPPAQFLDAIRKAVGADADEQAWQAVLREFEQRLNGPLGEAQVGGGPNEKRPAPVANNNNAFPAQGGRGAVALPVLPPAWTNDQLDAEGVAPRTGSKLKDARAAEADARDKLSAQVGALPLGDGLTIAAAADRDPEVGRAVSRALRGARTSRVDYRPDDVGVRMGLNLRDLWQELAGPAR